MAPGQSPVSLEDERRWEDVESGLGALGGTENEWDADPAGWVSLQRQHDRGRLG